MTEAQQSIQYILDYYGFRNNIEGTDRVYLRTSRGSELAYYLGWVHTSLINWFGLDCLCNRLSYILEGLYE